MSIVECKCIKLVLLYAIYVSLSTVARANTSASSCCCALLRYRFFHYHTTLDSSFLNCLLNMHIFAPEYLLWIIILLCISQEFRKPDEMVLIQLLEESKHKIISAWMINQRNYHYYIPQQLLGYCVLRITDAHQQILRSVFSLHLMYFKEL